jgi:hypothetical protein
VQAGFGGVTAQPVALRRGAGKAEDQALARPGENVRLDLGRLGSDVQRHPRTLGNAGASAALVRPTKEQAVAMAKRMRKAGAVLERYASCWFTTDLTVVAS